MGPGGEGTSPPPGFSSHGRKLVSSDCFNVLTSGSCNAKTVQDIGKNVAIFVIGGQFSVV